MAAILNGSAVKAGLTPVMADMHELYRRFTGKPLILGSDAIIIVFKLLLYLPERRK